MMSKRVKTIRWAHGSESIELKNGSRIRFLARSRSTGRGFSADTLYFDEAFRLDSEMVGGVLPILSARKDPQLWVVSSAPQHQSEYLHSLLARADSGGDGRLLCAEWGNPRDTELSDQTAWARANPTLGVRISYEHVEAELKSLSSTLMGQAEFARERLGVRDEFGPAEWETFDEAMWEAVTSG